MRGVSFRFKGKWRGVLFCAKGKCAVFYSVLRENARCFILTIRYVVRCSISLTHFDTLVYLHTYREEELNISNSLQIIFP